MLYQDYAEIFEDLAHGEPKCRGIRFAIDKALERQDFENALILYFDYVEEDYFYGDGFQAAILFPEYVSCFDSHPELHEKYSYNFMWAFKWALSCFESFYQIPLSQITDMYRQYSEYCEKLNYNKRSYYRKLWCMMSNYGLKSLPVCSSIEQAHRLMMHCPLDDLSEVKAGEADDLSSYYLDIEKDIDKALKAAEPILSGKVSCSTVPHYTYSNFAMWYFEHNDLEKAENYAKKSLRLIMRDFVADNSLMEHKGKILMILAYTDLPEALKFFRRQIKPCSANECGWDNFHFFRGAYHLMHCLEKIGEQTVRILFPDTNDPIYNESNNYSTAVLKKYYFDKAKFIADRFDERDGNHHFNYLLNKKYNY